ncbi:MAG: LCP family protein, partial [Acutalibacteraceae bacterium]
EDLTFTANKGYPAEYSEKIIKKNYKDALFSSQDTDLENGIDKHTYSVNNKEYKGSACVIFSFDNKNGWVYKKTDDSKVKFKKGVTHKENGLYTNSNIKNVVFFGRDTDSDSGRSDCMMLISIDSNTGKIKQTSFMRDTYINIPGYGYNKMNAAYAFGGPELAVKTIEQNYGIKIDNYVATSFKTFKEVINALGGVDVNITSDEAGYINWQIGKNGQGSVGYVSTAGGVTHLNGQQALWLCRDRGGNGYSGNDFTRTSRQRRVIRSLITTYKNYTPDKVLATLKVLIKYVDTDLSAEDLSWFAQRSVKFFKYETAERCVPDDGEWHADYTSGGAWIISIDNFSGLKSDIQKYIYEDLK